MNKCVFKPTYSWAGLLVSQNLNVHQALLVICVRVCVRTCVSVTGFLMLTFCRTLEQFEAFIESLGSKRHPGDEKTAASQEEGQGTWEGCTGEWV